MDVANNRCNRERRSGWSGNEHGLTLVEAVVAAALLLLTFGALILSFTRMSQASVGAQYSLDAMHIARAEIEALRVAAYSNVVSYTNIALANTLLQSVGGKKHCTVLTTTNDYKDIELTITWSDPGSPATSSLTLFTTICNTN